VLQGQCLRSNAGLFYESFEEFLETLALIQSNRRLALEMGQNGREYFQRHYAWPVIVRKYMEMFGRLREEDAKGAARPPIEPLPGWFARRRADCRAGDEVVRGLPAGPAPRTGGRR
jgi:hypothetical protein